MHRCFSLSLKGERRSQGKAYRELALRGFIVAVAAGAAAVLALIATSAGGHIACDPLRVNCARRRFAESTFTHWELRVGHRPAQDPQLL